tara:strand:+ start:1305 stop:2219 length:915 start_codon:yes stop_codon:yes gene_type:complete
MSLESSILVIVKEQVDKAYKPMIDKLSSENYSLSTRIDWTEKKLNEALEKLSTRNNDLFDNEVSGDKIEGGTITSFSSTGIQDTASSKRVTITDENVTIENDIYVKGKINCDTLYYQGAVATNIDASNSIRIGGNEVLWQDRLGNAVKSSKLTEVGVLKTLNVADILTVDGGRVGINSLQPGGALGVAKDGLEIVIDVIGSTPFVGTNTSDKFSIGTNREPTLFVSHDNKIGIKIKNPKEDLDIAGAIRFQGQTHQYLTGAPTGGNHERGDIVWNSKAESGKPLGWVCIKAGAPGTWRQFGDIS